MNWPNQKRFAFTIVDDTDNATVENVKPVYDFLSEMGLKTTKTVWPLAPSKKRTCSGMTCQDEEYLKWLYSLNDAGFEIAFHGATDHTSPREDVEQAIKVFHELFGGEQFLYCCHAGQEESIYWGRYRLGGIRGSIYTLATLLRKHNQFSGHLEGSLLFWGDLCQKHVRYLRNFLFSEINTLKVCPEMPYHDPSRPYVNYWFASSDGADVRSFCKLISEKNQDSLEQEGGLCIVYTHFAHGFWSENELDRDFVHLTRLLSKRQGWFAPASTVLDYLREQPEWAKDVDPSRLKELEWKWLFSKLVHGAAAVMSRLLLREL